MGGVEVVSSLVATALFNAVVVVVVWEWKADPPRTDGILPDDDWTEEYCFIVVVVGRS